MNDLLRRLRLQRIDGRSDHDAMRDAAAAIEVLEERVFQMDALRARVAELEAALSLAVDAMRAPLDGWKGEVERQALDVARATLRAGVGLSGNKPPQCFSTEGDDRR